MSRINSILISLLCTLITCHLALASPSPEPASPSPGPGLDLKGQLDSLFTGLPHTSFEWVKADGVSDRAAMRLPVNLAGTRGWFQLDTGLDATLVYGDLPARRGWETLDGMYHVPSFDIGAIRLGPTWLRNREGTSGEGETIGSLGLDLLIGYLVLIDYPGRRLAILKPGEAPLWLLQRTSWTPAELRDAKLFMTVVLGETTVSGIFFDTGTSAFDMTVDFDKWIELTGCAGPESASAQFSVNSWGNRIHVIGCPARGPLVIGSAQIPNARVFYIKEQPDLFASWPFPATGLIGNAPFWDQVAIIDLGLRPRFGLVR
jgi:hypothetical protein